MKTGNQHFWSNNHRNQKTSVIKIHQAANFSDLLNIVRFSKDNQLPIKAVGAGHAWSDIALTEGIVVDTRKLNQVLDVDCLKRNVDQASLFRTEAGISLRRLNKVLEKRGLSLSNMGGWDEQTLAGVISTSTHGSGIGHGPMSDQVVSLDIISSGGVIARVEPLNGQTDPEAFSQKYPDWKLIQDDSYFNTFRVGLGSTGTIYAITIKVVPFRYLKEERKLEKWGVVHKQLQDLTLLSQNEHVEVYLNPYRIDADSLCLVTTRNPTGSKPSKLPHRNILPETLAYLHILSSRVITFLVRRYPSLTSSIINLALRLIARASYIDKCYRVYNLGSANRMPAYSMEIAVPLNPTESALMAVEAIHEVAIDFAKRSVVTVSPISLRFVKASEGYMSMMYGTDTMTIELINLRGMRDGYKLLEAYEKKLYAFQGRPHWGQYHILKGELISTLYPKYQQWQAINADFNDNLSLMKGPFSERTKILP